MVATLYGPRLITELIATTERLLATYHRLKFTSTHEPFVQAVEHLIETVQATVTNATGTDTWDLRRPPHLHRHHPYHCRRHRARAELRSDSADRVTLRTSRTLLSGVTRNAATLDYHSERYLASWDSFGSTGRTTLLGNTVRPKWNSIGIVMSTSPIVLSM